MELYQDTYTLARVLLQRGVGAIYFLAFLSTLKQFPALLGEDGLLPVPDYLQGRTFRTLPTLFHLHYSDRLLRAVAWLGLFLSLLTITGLSERGPIWLSLLVWLTLWFLYLSIVNVGQTFYGFGWESMLLEAGFFVAFLGPTKVQAPALVVWLLRWMLFRVELGAGLIKLRHDKCWRDLTCLFYHYETQPQPNPLSWYFHHLPKWFHKVSVGGSHVVQLVIPFGLFAPQPVATICGICIAVHQLWLVVCGNYSWLNWLTIVLSASAVGDQFFHVQPPNSSTMLPFQLLVFALTAVTIYLSIEPTKNLFSKQQRMNCSYNPIRLVNSYGAFGSVTKDRFEVVLEGSADPFLTPGAEWREYRFKGKPVDTAHRPPQIAPYHWRLDWQMWFLPFSARVVDGKLRLFREQRWFVRLVEKLLEGDEKMTALLAHNPFPKGPPVYIRAQYYRYRYTTPQERAHTGEWWVRELVGTYLGPRYLQP